MDHNFEFGARDVESIIEDLCGVERAIENTVTVDELHELAHQLRLAATAAYDLARDYDFAADEAEAEEWDEEEAEDDE